MNSILQDEKSSEKFNALPYSDEDFEKLEERFKSLFLLRVLEIKEASEEAKRNYREALKQYIKKSKQDKQGLPGWQGLPGYSKVYQDIWGTWM